MAAGRKNESGRPAEVRIHCGSYQGARESTARPSRRRSIESMRLLAIWIDGTLLDHNLGSAAFILQPLGCFSDCLMECMIVSVTIAPRLTAINHALGLTHTHIHC